MVNIDHKIGNPYDNVLKIFSDEMSPFFRRMNFTPDGITALSAILGAASLYNLYEKNTRAFSIYLVLSYMFDIMSDVYSEKYGIDESTRSIQLNRYKNILLLIVGALILYSKYKILDSPVSIVVLITLFFLSLITLGCQNVVKNDAVIGNIDSNVCEERLTYLKWVGSGTFILAVMCVVFYLEESNYTPQYSSNLSRDRDRDLDYSSSSANIPISTGTLSFDQDFNNMSTFTLKKNNPEVVVINKEDLDFINQLKNFGSVSLNQNRTSSNDLLNPYTSTQMANNIIKN
jgi:hypothetical protein